MLVELRLELRENMYYLCLHIQTVQASSEVYLKKINKNKLNHLIVMQRAQESAVSYNCLVSTMMMNLYVVQIHQGVPFSISHTSGRSVSAHLFCLWFQKLVQNMF